MVCDDLRKLVRSDIPDGMLLKDGAGWNQTVEDWQRLLDLEPKGCFAVERDGAVVATATAIRYGCDLAWIGMVLTAPHRRGQGFASLLMEHVLQYLEDCGVACAGLDATDLGIGIYEKFGFVARGQVERWARPALAARWPGADVEAWTLDAEMDGAAFGSDRGRLLRSLARDGAASIPALGYAMGRAGSKAAYFGPCVAKSAEAATRLLRWFLAWHAAEPVYWDILCGNSEAAELARSHGFEPVRRLTRMFRIMSSGATVPESRLSELFAIAGFEYG